jgi:circadian clock protein KaiB
MNEINKYGMNKKVNASPSGDVPETALQSLPDAGQSSYALRLYVSGMTPNSLRAIRNLRQICAEHLEKHYHLEIIDIYQQPHLAREQQIIAVPTLIKELPLPVCRFIGDMSQTERILSGLDIRPPR